MTRERIGLVLFLPALTLFVFILEDRPRDVEMVSFADLLSRLRAQPITLKSYLLKLVLAGVLPLLVFSIGMVVLLARQKQAALERGLVETTRALTVALDKEFESSITALKGLASSEHLGIGDVVGFYDVSFRVLESQPAWKKIILLDAAGNQIFSTTSPVGATVPAVIERETLDVVLRNGRPAVSNLFNADPLGATQHEQSGLLLSGKL